MIDRRWKFRLTAAGQGAMVSPRLKSISSSAVGEVHWSQDGVVVIKICNAYLEYSRRSCKSQETNFAMHDDKVMPR